LKIPRGSRVAALVAGVRATPRRAVRRRWFAAFARHAPRARFSRMGGNTLWRFIPRSRVVQRRLPL